MIERIKKVWFLFLLLKLMDEEKIESSDNSIAYDGEGHENYQWEMAKLRASADYILWVLVSKKKNPLDDKESFCADEKE